MINRYRRKIACALRGILEATTDDFGFRSQIYLGVTLLFVVGVWFTPITSLEVLLIVLAYVLILITELQNSAVETALDKIHPELDENIRKTKDMAAGSVLLAGGYLFFTLGLIYFIGI